MSDKNDRILVLGIGSPIMCDDAIGFRVLKELARLDLPKVDLEEACTSGFDLIDMMLDYGRVIIVDAIMNTGKPIGEVMVLDSQAFTGAVHGTNPHEANIPTTLELGRTLEPERFPKDVQFVAVEVEDIFTMSEQMTPKVEAALPHAVEVVVDLIKGGTKAPGCS